MTSFFARGTTPADQYVNSIRGVFARQLGILDSTIIQVDSVLRRLRFLLQADLFDSELEAARYLLQGGHIRGAGVVAGVVLEAHLKTLCNSHDVTIETDRPTLGYLIRRLSETGVIDETQTTLLRYLNQIRIACDHDTQDEPTADDVESLINETNRVKSTIF